MEARAPMLQCFFQYLQLPNKPVSYPDSWSMFPVGLHKAFHGFVLAIRPCQSRAARTERSTGQNLEYHSSNDSGARNDRVGLKQTHQRLDLKVT